MIELSKDNGWIAYDNRGIIMPWYTSGVLDILDAMDLTNKRVFEFGVGNSTDWYNSRSAITYGVESQTEWLRFGTMLYTDEYRYTRSVLNYHPFDIIVIDGIFRDNCAEFALRKLKFSGMLIIDNWKQESAGWKDWPLTEELTKDIDCKVYPQDGHDDWQTAIFKFK